jgi:hypothetical protein
MTYQRKTRDEFELQGNYGHGWECLTTEDTLAECWVRLREYRDNEGGEYQIKVLRVQIGGDCDV